MVFLSITWITLALTFSTCLSLRSSNQCFQQLVSFCSASGDQKTCDSQANYQLDCSNSSSSYCSIESSPRTLKKSQTVTLVCQQNESISIQAITYVLPKASQNLRCVATGTEACMNEGICSSPQCCTDCCQDRSKNVSSCRDLVYNPVTACEGVQGTCDITVQRRKMNNCGDAEFESCTTTQANQYSKCYSIWVEVSYFCNISDTGTVFSSSSSSVGQSLDSTTSSDSTTSPGPQGQKQSPLTVIVGGIAGGVVAVVLVIAVIIICVVCKRSNSEAIPASTASTGVTNRALDVGMDCNKTNIDDTEDVYEELHGKDRDTYLEPQDVRYQPATQNNPLESDFIGATIINQQPDLRDSDYEQPIRSMPAGSNSLQKVDYDSVKSPGYSHLLPHSHTN